jgi:hypothetical protein
MLSNEFVSSTEEVVVLLHAKNKGKNKKEITY